VAAALAAGISIDDKLGMTQDIRDTEMDDMRSQIAEMRQEMANLRAELTGPSRSGGRTPGGAARTGGHETGPRRPATGLGSAVRGGWTTCEPTGSERAARRPW